MRNSCCSASSSESGVVIVLRFGQSSRFVVIPCCSSLCVFNYVAHVCGLHCVLLELGQTPKVKRKEKTGLSSAGLREVHLRGGGQKEQRVCFLMEMTQQRRKGDDGERMKNEWSRVVPRSLVVVGGEQGR